MREQFPVRFERARQQEARHQVDTFVFFACHGLAQQAVRNPHDHLLVTRAPAQANAFFRCEHGSASFRDPEAMPIAFDLGAAVQGGMDQRKIIERACRDFDFGTIP